MAVQNPIGIALAGMLSLSGLKLKALYRTVIFLPTMLSVVIVGFSWNLILSPLWGVAEGALKSVGLGSWFAPWLGLPSTALITLALISVWQFVGIPMMLIYASLLNIPEELVDAARVDGLGQFRIFWHIKLPLVLPTIGLVSILTFVGNFNAFDLIYSVKGALAGPNFASDVLGTFFYRTFFGFQLQLGNPTMGAAVATVMFFIILVGVCFYLFVIQRRMRRYCVLDARLAPMLRRARRRRRRGGPPDPDRLLPARDRADPARRDELLQGAQSHLRRAARVRRTPTPSRSSATPRCSPPRMSGPIS